MPTRFNKLAISEEAIKNPELTYDALALKFGASQERIRQILAEMGVVEKRKEARKLLKSEEKTRQSEERAKRKKESIEKSRQTQIKRWSNPEEHKRQGEKIRASIIAGRHTPGGCYKSSLKSTIKTEKGGSITCKSSWEVVYAKALDADPEVIEFNKDTTRIWFEYEGIKRIYIADFLVTHLSGEKELVEVKPEFFLKQKINQAKVEAARQWCSENNVKFSVVTERELTSLVTGFRKQYCKRDLQLQLV